jgi:hypothetical protein
MTIPKLEDLSEEQRDTILKLVTSEQWEALTERQRTTIVDSILIGEWLRVPTNEQKLPESREWKLPAPEEEALWDKPRSGDELEAVASQTANTPTSRGQETQSAEAAPEQTSKRGSSKQTNGE